MININSNIRINHAAINRIKQNNIKALEMTAEALKTEVINSQRVPKNTGALQNDITVNKKHSNKGHVSLDQTLDYSRRVYFHPEWNFNKTKNANAQGLWYDYWIKGRGRNFCRDTFAEFSRRLNRMGGI